MEIKNTILGCVGVLTNELFGKKIKNGKKPWEQCNFVIFHKKKKISRAKNTILCCVGVLTNELFVKKTIKNHESIVILFFSQKNVKKKNKILGFVGVLTNDFFGKKTIKNEVKKYSKKSYFRVCGRFDQCIFLSIKKYESSLY